MEAPILLSPVTDDDPDTYFIKQPSSAKEIRQAICAMDVCCVSAVRYRGNDPEILKRADPDACDNMRPEYNRNKIQQQKDTLLDHLKNIIRGRKNL